MPALSPYAPKWIERLTAVGSWVIGIAAACTAPHFSDRLPFCIFAWFVFYMILAKSLKKWGGKSAQMKFDGYPAWSYDTGVVHGVVVLPSIFLGAIYISGFPGWNNETFYMEAWNDTLTHFVMQQVHCCIIGYLLKDYVLYDGLETAFLVHHFASIGVCALSLHFPLAACLLSLQGAHAEFGSAFFSFQKAHPSYYSRIAYLLFMPVDNAFGAWIAYIVYLENIPAWPWKAIYVPLCAVIIVLRQGGWFLHCNLSLQKPDEAASPNPRKEKKKAK